MSERFDGLMQLEGPPCVNCGSTKPFAKGWDERLGCVECSVPAGMKVDLSKPLCSICRGRHGLEKVHACE